MREKVPIIKNRDRSEYRFDTHKGIDFAGADYLTANDEFSMNIFFERCNRQRLVRAETSQTIFL